MNLRNWIEEIIGKQIAWINCVGCENGRKVYAVTFMDGAEEDYFIDYDAKTAERRSA